jgi:uncharacterized membrane protein YraQ (UPF0718 family)
LTTSNIIIVCLAVAVTLIALFRGVAVTGASNSLGILKDTWIAILFAFVIVGMMKAIIGQGGQGVEQFGVIKGSIAGLFTFGGIYTNTPLTKGFIDMGYSVGAIMAFVTSWSLMSPGRLIFESSILGWKFVFIRVASSFFVPVIVGYVSEIVSRVVK